MVFIGGIVWDVVEIVFRKERVDFVAIVLYVYYHRGFSFVCSVIIAFWLVIFCFIHFRIYNCLLCVVLWWLVLCYQ